MQACPLTQPPELPSRRSMRRGAGLLGLTGHAQQPGRTSPVAATRSRSGAEYINEETQAQIDRGLDLLARGQLNDGSFSGGPVLDRAGGGWTVGVTALAGLALMSAGNQPGRGKYGRVVAKAVDYVASMANGPNPGFLTTPESQQTGRLSALPSPMYSHGFGTLFLSEVCGMVPVRECAMPRCAAALDQAVAFTVAAQNREGGWRYEPPGPVRRRVRDGGPDDGAAGGQNAGVFVRKNVMDDGATYIRRLPDARRRVQLLEGAGRISAFARSAAAIVGLYSAGIYDGKEIDRGLQVSPAVHTRPAVLAREIPPQHYWYGQYYAALAMWTAGDEYWTAWLPAIRDELLAKARGQRRNMDRRLPRLSPTPPRWPHHPATAEQLSADLAEVTHAEWLLRNLGTTCMILELVEVHICHSPFRLCALILFPLVFANMRRISIQEEVVPKPSAVFLSGLNWIAHAYCILASLYPLRFFPYFFAVSGLPRMQGCKGVLTASNRMRNVPLMFCQKSRFDLPGAWGRFDLRITSLRPDQVSSTAQTFTSTSPKGSATSRIVSSVISVAYSTIVLSWAMRPKACHRVRVRSAALEVWQRSRERHRRRGERTRRADWLL